MVNLIERAFGEHPLRPAAAAALPQRNWTSAYGSATFTEPTDIGGITYGAEWSTNLQTDWVAIPDTGNGGRHTFIFPLNGEPRLFMSWRIAKLGN